jgi:hypothetical protein
MVYPYSMTCFGGQLWVEWCETWINPVVNDISLLSPGLVNSILFRSIGMCRMRRFLVVLRSFFHSSLSFPFSCHSSSPNYSSILPYFILPSISWPCCFQIHIQASLVIRDLTCVFAITWFRWKKAVRKLYSNFAVTVYGGGVTVWHAHQLVTSYQCQCERECWAVDVERSSFIFKAVRKRSRHNCDKNCCKCKKQRKAVTLEEKLSVNSLDAFSCYAMIYRNELIA